MRCAQSKSPTENSFTHLAEISDVSASDKETGTPNTSLPDMGVGKAKKIVSPSLGVWRASVCERERVCVCVCMSSWRGDC